ncbi:MAG: disulfide bond formation protein B [Aquisalimonadaceae bacterium]
MLLSWIERRRLRVANLMGFLACAVMIAAAYYMQYGMGLEPCPLCIFQRGATLGMGLGFLLALLHGPKSWGRYLYGLLIAAFAGLGVALAGRHIWLQSLPPDQVPACGPGLDYMLSTFPFMDALRMTLEGSGECAEVDLVLGLSLPVWTLMAFIIVGLYGLWVNFKRRERAIWL